MSMSASTKETRSALCGCGKPVYQELAHCLPCLQAQSTQHQRFTLPTRPAKQLTPPPSQASSPRRSTEMAPPFRSNSHPSEASAVLTQAFAEEREEETSPLFPASLYRTPTRSSSGSGPSRRPSDSPSRPSSRTMASGSSSVKTSRSSTPTPDYAPMAAGFARLSVKDRNDSTEHLRSLRPSFELEARMFSGPA